MLENYKYLFEKCDTVELSEPTLSSLVEHSKVQGCACGVYYMRINSITPDGKIPVSPCVYMHDYRVGDILTDDILDIVNSEQFRAFQTRKENYKNIEGCKDCEKGNICRGGCFAMAYTYNKSIIENLIYTSGNKPEIVMKDGKIIIENYMFKNKIEYDIIQEKNRIINLLENNNIF